MDGAIEVLIRRVLTFLLQSQSHVKPNLRRIQWKRDVGASFIVFRLFYVLWTRKHHTAGSNIHSYCYSASINKMTNRQMSTVNLKIKSERLISYTRTALTTPNCNLCDFKQTGTFLYIMSVSKMSALEWWLNRTWDNFVTSTVSKVKSGPAQSVHSQPPASFMLSFYLEILDLVYLQSSVSVECVESFEGSRIQQWHAPQTMMGSLEWDCIYSDAWFPSSNDVIFLFLCT